MNSAGMVMDFKMFKKLIKTNIEDVYDHSLILRDVDPLVDKFKEVTPEQHLNVVHDSPTAEWMAEEYFNILSKAFLKVDPDVKVLSVSVQETENNIATYSR